MHIAAADAGAGQTQHGLARLQQHINQRVPRQMAALEQHRLRAHGQQRLGGAVQTIDTDDGLLQQQGRLVQVGGDQGGTRKQLAHQHLHRVAGDQTVATGGHHHRVEHHVFEPVMVNRPGHHLDDFRGMQHADLDRVDANILHHRLQLRLQKGSWHRVNALHAHRVLRCQRGDGGHAVAAQCGKGFQIRLNAGGTATVGAGDAQDPGIAGGRRGSVGVAGVSDLIHGRDYAQALGCRAVGQGPGSQKGLPCTQ